MVSHLLWLGGAYLAGTLPSTLIAAKIRAAPAGRPWWRRPAAKPVRPTHTS